MFIFEDEQEWSRGGGGKRGTSGLIAVEVVVVAVGCVAIVLGCKSRGGGNRSEDTKDTILLE